MAFSPSQSRRPSQGVCSPAGSVAPFARPCVPTKSIIEAKAAPDQAKGAVAKISSMIASTGPGAARHSLLQKTCRAQPLARTIETHPAVNPPMPQGHQKAALRPTKIVITTILTRPIAP